MTDQKAAICYSDPIWTKCSQIIALSWKISHAKFRAVILLNKKVFFTRVSRVWFLPISLYDSYMLKLSDLNKIFGDNSIILGNNSIRKDILSNKKFVLKRVWFWPISLCGSCTNSGPITSISTNELLFGKKKLCKIVNSITDFILFHINMHAAFILPSLKRMIFEISLKDLFLYILRIRLRRFGKCDLTQSSHACYSRSYNIYSGTSVLASIFWYLTHKTLIVITCS